MSFLVPDSVTGIVILLCCLATTHHVIVKVLAYIKSRHTRGPIWANFSSWQHRKALLRYKPAEWYAQITEKYGPIAKIAPNLLITSSPKLWMHINTKPGYTRADWFFRAMRVDYQHDHLFSLTDNAEHDRRRKLVGPGFYGSESLKFELSVNERLEELLHLIRSKYISSDANIVSMDLAAKIQYFTHDVISTITFGKPFNMLQNDTDTNGYIQSTKQGFVIANILVALGLAKLSQSSLIGPMLTPAPDEETGYGKLLALSVKMIEERAASPRETPEDMLDSFIHHGLRGHELRSEIIDSVVIGSIGPTYAICSVILLTTTNAYVLAKVHREIDNAVNIEKGAFTDSGVATFNQVKQLPYLQAVIRESLRLLPPLVGLFPRQVPAGGDSVTVDGETVHIPDGTYVGRSVYAMYRCKDTYGQDADTFRPERWFDPDPVKLANMIRVNELIFNHGRYQCMGRVIAHMEITKAVFELLRNFEFAILHPNGAPWKAVDLFGIYGLSDFWVQVRERSVASRES